MHGLHDRPGTGGGFVHIPYSREEAIGTDRSYMRMDQLTTALTAVMRGTRANATDVKVGGGSLD
ncbi:hypothetical protein [Clavibacter michiganensis]|uniref:hypothetical protein n=1 Tax=Clavibacter michiganensis TaxID=28447 RepID=UPI00215A0483|nr:hypothetical protein [Clavibacter michiganensis]